MYLNRIRRERPIYLIRALLILAAANIIIGAILIVQSRSAMKTQIDQRMLDIANTAAYMLDGDAMEKLTADDRGSREYEAGLTILRNFQQNIDLAYIYAVNCGPDGSFSFSIDPAADTPGEFGSPVVSTDALQAAASGMPAVDDKPYEDEWGRFYSAYSPVFDSEGKVACIVAVDFSAEWIDKQTTKQTAVAIVITSFTLLLGIIMAISINSRYKKRIKKFNEDIAELENGFKELDKMIKLSSVKKLYLMPDSKETEVIKTLASGETYGTDETGDEIALIDKDLQTLIGDMKHYIEYVHAQTYIDQLTGIGNRLSYKEAINNIGELISNDTDGSKRFAVCAFDINGLEMVNTRYGFEIGDEIIYAAATVIRNAYGHRKVFRIASDEFIAILENKGLLDLEQYAKTMNTYISAFNAARGDKPKLALSKGSAVYEPGKDKSYRDVFIRAEQALEREKKDYYAKLSEETLV